MARENYSFNKRQKELAQKKKKEEKLKMKLLKKNAQALADSGQAPQENLEAPV
jgi:hypothetical protein